jgi:hypothetical protein
VDRADQRLERELVIGARGDLAALDPARDHLAGERVAPLPELFAHCLGAARDQRAGERGAECAVQVRVERYGERDQVGAERTGVGDRQELLGIAEQRVDDHVLPGAPASVDRRLVDPGPHGDFTDGERIGTLFPEELERRVEHCLPDTGGTPSRATAYLGVVHTVRSLTQADLL